MFARMPWGPSGAMSTKQRWAVAAQEQGTSQEKKAHADLPRGTGDCPGALSVSALRVRLGQDRREYVLESRTVRMSEGHPILHRIVNQTKICNLSMIGSK